MSSVQNRNDKVLLSPEFNADISRWINFMQGVCALEMTIKSCKTQFVFPQA
jgi:hypothetical protein